jgi:hypothetical protein
MFRNALIAALTLAGPGPAADTLAFRDVSVLPMSGTEVLQHQNVVIAGGRIRAVGPIASTSIPAGATVVDGRGRYLMPGLADMHVHLFGTEELPVFVGYGVLTVRDLNGSPQVLGWRRAVESDSLTGPRLIVSGPMIAGGDIPWSNKVTPATATEAEAVVVAQHAAGYDQIKIYDGLSREVFAAALATAKRFGMLSSGHIPQAVGFDGVLASGMTGLEHLDKTVAAVVGHDLDTLQIPGIADRIKRSGMWVTPTLESMIQLALIATGRYDSLINRPEALAAPTAIREFWTSVSIRLKGNRPVQPGVRYNRWTEYQLRLAGALARAGVPLLAGTDLPNAVLVPGYSLHRELEALVTAGLTRYQALEAATSAPARFMREAGDWGVVAAGQRANLLLLDANPLLGFETLGRPAGVVLRGRWLDSVAVTRFRAVP